MPFLIFGSGSFAVRDHLRSWDHLRTRTVHIFVKSTKVRSTAQSTKTADGIYAKLHIFNRPVQKEGNLPGFHIHTVCTLHFDHSSELKFILK